MIQKQNITSVKPMTDTMTFLSNEDWKIRVGIV